MGRYGVLAGDTPDSAVAYALQRYGQGELPDDAPVEIRMLHAKALPAAVGVLTEIAKRPGKGDFVKWRTATGNDIGQVELVVEDGDVPGATGPGGVTVSGSAVDPAARIRIWGQGADSTWQATDQLIAVKLIGLQKTDKPGSDSKRTQAVEEAKATVRPVRRDRGGQFATVHGPHGRRPDSPPGTHVPPPPAGFVRDGEPAEHKSAATLDAQDSTTLAAGGIIGNPEDGVLDVILSVTGVVDDVDDIIEPGAYARTLRERTPKILADHDWNRKVGKCESIAELLPGDPGLPKTTLSGEPWPAAAGALIAKVRFNLDTELGRQTYAETKFYGEDPLSGAQFSIGYNVPAGQAWKDAQGIRHIKDLDLYEGSAVLWGAMRLTGILPEQKAASDSEGGRPALERKALPGLVQPAEVTAWDEPHIPVMAAPGDDDDEPMCRCGRPYYGEVDEHAIDATEQLDDDEVTALFEAVQDDVHSEVDLYLSIAEDRADGNYEGKAAPKCKFGGEPATKKITRGTKTIYTCDKHEALGRAAMRGEDAGSTSVTDLTKKPAEAGTKVAGQEATPGDVAATTRLRQYWVHGAGAAKIRWGQPGDFKRCVKHLRKYMGERANGYCQLRHKEALGVYAGQEGGGRNNNNGRKALLPADAPPGFEIDAAGVLTVESLEGRKFVELVDDAGIEVKDGQVPGSWEADMEKLREALSDALLPPSDDDGSGMLGRGGVYLRATFDDRVVVDVWRPGANGDETYEVPYTVDDEGAVQLGTPVRGRMESDFVPEGGSGLPAAPSADTPVPPPAATPPAADAPAETKVAADTPELAEVDRLLLEEVLSR